MAQRGERSSQCTTQPIHIIPKLKVWNDTFALLYLKWTIFAILFCFCASNELSISGLLEPLHLTSQVFGSKQAPNDDNMTWTWCCRTGHQHRGLPPSSPPLRDNGESLSHRGRSDLSEKVNHREQSGRLWICWSYTHVLRLAAKWNLIQGCLTAEKNYFTWIIMCWWYSHI